MIEAQCRVSWDSYFNHVSKGFAHLQQNAEFVDMTLAADGHLVKVHKNIVALASPYLKAMLQSASCHHPVIFLNNISHEILGYILEYMYTGEVKISVNVINKFIDACKALCISGVSGVETNPVLKTPLAMQQESMSLIQSIDDLPQTHDESFATRITFKTQDILVGQDENYTKTNKNYEEKLPVAPIPNPSTYIIHNEHASNQIPISECTNLSDINIDRIDDSVSVKPNKECLEPNTNMANNPVTILGDVPVNFDTWQIPTPMKETVNFTLGPNNVLMKADQSIPRIELNLKPIDDSINTTFNTNDWQKKYVQSIPHIEFNAYPTENPLHIPLNTDEWQTEPIEQASQIQLNTNTTRDNVLSSSSEEWPSNDNIDMNLLKKKVIRPKKIKNSGANFKLKLGSTEQPDKLKLNKVNRIKMDQTPHYTVSSKGSLQLILNRFLYHSHHHAKSGCKRRWRCIDYRKTRCPAYIDTDNEVIIAKSEDHCHDNHDNQIRIKIKSNIVFASFSNANRTIKSLKENAE